MIDDYTKNPSQLLETLIVSTESIVKSAIQQWFIDKDFYLFLIGPQKTQILSPLEVAKLFHGEIDFKTQQGFDKTKENVFQILSEEVTEEFFGKYILKNNSLLLSQKQYDKHLNVVANKVIEGMENPSDINSVIKKINDLIQGEQDYLFGFTNNGSICLDSFPQETKDEFNAIINEHKTKIFAYEDLINLYEKNELIQ